MVTATKNMSHKDKILKLLSRKNGALNTELNKIAFRYSSRIYELRKEHNILSSQVPNTGNAVWRYILIKK